MEIYRDEELLYDDIAVLYVFNPVSTSGKKEFAVSCCFDNELFEDLKEMTIIFSQTLEDAMTFHIASDLVVEKDYDRIWLAHEDGREADVEGIYIALQIHDDSDYYHIITNAPDMLVFAFLAQIYITAIACPAMEQKAMGAPMLKFRDHAWDKINKTNQIHGGKNMGNEYKEYFAAQRLSDHECMQFRSAGPSGGPQSAGRDRGVRIPAYGYDVLGAERLSAGRVRHAVDLFQRHGGRQDRRTDRPAVHAVESPRAPFHSGDDGLCPGTAKEETEIQAEKTDKRGAGAHRPGQGNPGGTKRHDRRGSPSLSAKMQYGRRQYSSGNRTDDPEHAGYLSLLRSLRLDGTVSGSISG